MFMPPVIMYVFLVAIGTDYDILVIARLRDQAGGGREPREAAGEALRHAGPTVAAAGFILAATFVTMTLAGNALLTDMGFVVPFGIAPATFVMAMFFTPSLTALIGHAAWWPGHGDRSGHPAGDRRRRRPAGRSRQRAGRLRPPLTHGTAGGEGPGALLPVPRMDPAEPDISAGRVPG